MQKPLAIAKNTLYQVLARLVSSGTSFLIVIMIARHFGVLGYGDCAKITAFVSLFYLIADFGFNAIFLQKEDNRMRFRDLLYPRLIFAGVIVVIINVLAAFLPYNEFLNTGYSPAVRIGIALFSLTLFTEAIIYTCLAVFQRELHYQLLLFSEIIGGSIKLLLVGIFVFSNTSLITLLLAFVISEIIQSITALVLTKERLNPVHFDHRFFFQLTRETIPIGLMIFFNLVYFRIDMVLLALFRSTQEVAVYDLAYKFFDFLIALPLFLSNSLYPSLLEHEKNNRITSAMAKRYVFVFFTLSLPLVLIVWIISPFIQLIKPEFIASSLPLRILATSLPVFFATSILQWVLIARKQQKQLMIVYLIATVINIVLNLFYIPQYGYIASAIITGVCELMIGIILGIIVFWKSK